MWWEEWLCPCKYLCHISCRSWHDEIILSGMCSILGEDLCAFLDCRDVLKSKFRDKMIHGFYFFPDTIEECDLELWHDEFERNSWESSSWSDIQEPHSPVIASLRSNPIIMRNSFLLSWITSFFAMTGTSLIDNTHPIEWVHKVLLHNLICVTNGREIGVTIVRHKKFEELLELSEFCIWELKTVRCEKWRVHNCIVSPPLQKEVPVGRRILFHLSLSCWRRKYLLAKEAGSSYLRMTETRKQDQNTLFLEKIHSEFDKKKKKKKYAIDTVPRDSRVWQSCRNSSNQWNLVGGKFSWKENDDGSLFWYSLRYLFGGWVLSERKKWPCNALIVLANCCADISRLLSRKFKLGILHTLWLVHRVYLWKDVVKRLTAPPNHKSPSLFAGGAFFKSIQEYSLLQNLVFCL